MALAHHHTAQVRIRPPESAVRELSDLATRLSCDVATDEPLARHTSMGVGGPTPLFVAPKHPEALADLIGWMARSGLAWRVMGAGSNLLVADHGVLEIVLNLTRLRSGATYKAPLANLPAGLPTASALRRSCSLGLSGLSWMAGLPGTIGGAAAGNSGCWGGEMADVVEHLDVVCRDGSSLRIEAQEVQWDYRKLDLSNKADSDSVIASVGVRLEEGNSEKLLRSSTRLQALKREQQPVSMRNLGCIFRNPEGSQTAGQLLDAAGCKGLRHGGAEVSTQHANFIVNLGTASSDDIEHLVDAAQTAVMHQFGIELATEIRRW